MEARQEYFGFERVSVSPSIHLPSRCLLLILFSAEMILSFFYMLGQTDGISQANETGC